MSFDPSRWLQSVFIHPTRDQFEGGFHRHPAMMQLKRKLQLWVVTCKFSPDRPYHATVVIRGVRQGHELASLLTATRVLGDSPVGFIGALSQTIHIVLGHGRPLIGLLASEEPLDRDHAVAQFPESGDQPSGAVSRT